MIQLKLQVHQYYTDLLNDKIASLQKVLDDLKESGANETKSTAGDKHETALAMLQIEQANKRAQMQQLVEQKFVLDKIDPVLTTVEIVTGSLVKISDQFYFISAALGKATIDGKQIIALSVQSPLGKVLVGLKKGDKAEFSGRSLLIEELV